MLRLTHIIIIRAKIKKLVDLREVEWQGFVPNTKRLSCQAAALAEEARIGENREEQVEKAGDTETGETSSGVVVDAGQAKETRTVINVATNHADSVRTGASDSNQWINENGANATNIMVETIMQTDGNMSLSDIAEEVEEEKIKKPKLRSVSFWMKSKDIQKEELVKSLKNYDISETDY